jgi:drug/metabolite transporter (DMT)-like permease
MRGGTAGIGTWVLLLLGVCGASMSAPLAAGTAASAVAVGFWRNALGTAVTLPYVAARRRDRMFRGLPRPAWAGSALAGVMLAIHFATWLSALRMTTVAAATALVGTTPIWTALLDVVRGVRVPRVVLAGIVIAIAGGLTVTGVDVAGDPRALAGDGLAILGAISFGAYIATGERVRRHVTTSEYAVLAYGTCALALAPAALLLDQRLVGFDRTTWLQLLALTVTAQLLGHTLINAVLPRIGPTTVALALLFETPGAIGVAWVWPGQTPSFWVIPGTALMLAGLAIVVRAGRGPVGTDGVVEVT